MQIVQQRPRPLYEFLAGIVLIAVVVLPGIAGSTAAYLGMVTLLLGAITAYRAESLRAAVHNGGNWLFTVAFLLIAIALVATAGNVSDFAAIGDFVPLLLVTPAFILFMPAAGRPRLDLFGILCVVGAAVALAVALVQVEMFNLPRATGVQSTAILFASSAVITGFLALVGVFAPGPRWRFALLVGPILGISAALLSGSRGPLLLAGLLSLLVIVTLVRQQDRRTAWLLVGGFAVLGLVGGAIMLQAFDLSRILSIGDVMNDLAQSGSTTDVSTALRLSFYESGLHAFVDSPLFGHGWWRRFSAASPYMTDAAAAWGAGRDRMHLHNDFINFLSATGVFGAVAYLMLLAAPIAGVFGQARGPLRPALLYGAAVLSVGFFASGLTDSMFSFEQPKSLYCLVSALLFAWSATTSAADPAAPR